MWTKNDIAWTTVDQGYTKGMINCLILRIQWLHMIIWLYTCILYTVHMIVSYYLLPGPVKSWNLLTFVACVVGFSKIFQLVLPLPIIVSVSLMELPYATYANVLSLWSMLIHIPYIEHMRSMFKRLIYTFLILLCGDRNCLYCDNQTLQTSEHVFVSPTICDALKALNKFVQLFLRNCWLKDMNISCVYPHNSAIVPWNVQKWLKQ